ncbi:MAG TPA: hypothetical protein VKS60_25275 [Stellaceae bacterium]|nr:hypothetical protein [Stellaceae bacterium]
MKAQHVIALIFGLLLAFPGLCFTAVGGGLMTERNVDDQTFGFMMLLVGVAFFAGTGGLLYFALRRKKPPEAPPPSP